MLRVFIERHLLDHVEEDYRQVLLEARAEALKIPGYISGETLQDVDDPLHYMVISTWRTRADWNQWLESAGRQRVMNLMAPMLAEDERVTLMAAPGEVSY